MYMLYALYSAASTAVPPTVSPPKLPGEQAGIQISSGGGIDMIWLIAIGVIVLLAILLLVLRNKKK